MTNYKCPVRLLLFYILLGFSFSSAAQERPDKIAAFGGTGNYEYLHAGAHFTIKQKYYMEAAFGLKPWALFREKYTMGYLLFGAPVLKRKETPRKINPFLQLKSLIWNLNNRYNRLAMFGINPELRLQYDLSERMFLCGNGGIIYNMLLYYQRKTYSEAGWPKEFQPSFSLQLFYRVK